MTLYARQGTHGPSELTRLQRENERMRHVFDKILQAAGEGQSGSAMYALDRLRLIQSYAETGLKQR